MALVHTRCGSTFRLSRARALYDMRNFCHSGAASGGIGSNGLYRVLVARNDPTRAGTTLCTRRRRLPPSSRRSSQPWLIVANQTPAVAATARAPISRSGPNGAEGNATGVLRFGGLLPQPLDHGIACLSRRLSEPFSRPRPGIGDQRRGRCLRRFDLLEASRRDLVPRDPRRAL
jgi:hypothetical protein